MSQLIELYTRMEAEAEARAVEPWFRIDRLPPSGSSHERTKFQREIPPGVVDRFRDFKIGGIGLEPQDYGITLADYLSRPNFDKLVDDPIVRDPKAERLIQVLVREQLKGAQPDVVQAFLHALDDSLNIGGRKHVVGFSRLIVCSMFSLKMAQRALRMLAVLHRHEVRPKVLLEIGGGYGKTFSDACALLGVRTGIYVDLPLNLLLAASYLNKLSPGKVNLVWSDDAEIREGAMNLVAPWLLEEKLAMPVDLALNFLSLQHMQAATQEFYLGILRRNGLGHLYHENRLHPRDRVEGALAGSASMTAARTLESQVASRPTFYSPDGRRINSPDGRGTNLTRELVVYGQLLRFD
ncbi:hypothetical protein BAL199_30542 [alpha proteobacterium BAL199]|nr:hypothetical protein BAL199_30542 [alpha proteobacterium BAL199]